MHHYTILWSNLDKLYAYYAHRPGKMSAIVLDENLKDNPELCLRIVQDLIKRVAQHEELNPFATALPFTITSPRLRVEE